MAKNNIDKFTKCSNCGACVNTCPVDALHVKKDGMYYSVHVDDSRCVNCGKCLLVCPVNVPANSQHIIASYIGYIDDNSVLYSSSSGGMFHAIAETVLNRGGVVFGAAFSQDCYSVVFKSTDEVTLLSLQKSKYVESDTGNSFKRIRSELESGREVLFCGTPCQVAGLQRFLNKKYDNLFTCDFSCGGLPSHKMYRMHLKKLEDKYSSKIKKVDFRPKNFGWHNYSIYIEFENGKVYTRLATLDPYYKAFLKGLSKRDYCYECDFANNHYSDIILADFWLHKQLSDIDNEDRGLSLLVTNSEKGEQKVRELSKFAFLEEIPIEKGCYNIKQNQFSEENVRKHNSFVQAVEQNGLYSAVNRDAPTSVATVLKQWLKQLLKKRKI